ncbi:hypothetical protein ACOME3_000164 [Neoechinorhynchus agilis]
MDERCESIKTTTVRDSSYPDNFISRLTYALDPNSECSSAVTGKVLGSNNPKISVDIGDVIYEDIAQPGCSISVIRPNPYRSNPELALRKIVESAENDLDEFKTQMNTLASHESSTMDNSDLVSATEPMSEVGVSTVQRVESGTSQSECNCCSKCRLVCHSDDKLNHGCNDNRYHNVLKVDRIRVVPSAEKWYSSDDTNTE